LYVNDCPLWLRIGAASSEGRGEGTWWTINTGMRLAPLAAWRLRFRSSDKDETATSRAFNAKTGFLAGGVVVPDKFTAAVRQAIARHQGAAAP
jgi:hypothetical protein